MRTISIHVSAADYDEFRSLAAQHGRPVAELIREAMSRWLSGHRRDGASLLDLEPIDCGSLLRPFERSDVAEEMFDP